MKISKVSLSFMKGFIKIFKNLKKNDILIGVAVIAVIITGVLIYADQNKGFPGFNFNFFGKSNEQIGKQVVDYINNNKLASETASMVSASEESGLIKVKIKIGAQEFDSYATKDGKFLFPQAIDMSPKKETTPVAQNTNNANQNQANTIVTKTNSPVFEAYVVARCPYGLQMQRAIAEAVKNVSSLAQYVKVRYIGAVAGNTITSMHGDAEAQENLRQICIREEQPAKYWSYVGCQMQAAGTEKSCEQSTGVNSTQLSACISDASRGVAYAKEDFDLNTKYGVQGSPTLVLNGATISESSYGGRSSDGVKSMVCAGFNSQPSLCSTALNTAAAAVSFSPTYAGSNSSGNSGATGAGCQPAQ